MRLVSKVLHISLGKIIAKHLYTWSVTSNATVGGNERDALCGSTVCRNTECIPVAALTSPATADISIN